MRLVILDEELLFFFGPLLYFLGMAEGSSAHGASEFTFLGVALGDPHHKAFGVKVVTAVSAVDDGSLVLD